MQKKIANLESADSVISAVQVITTEFDDGLFVMSSNY